MSTKETKIIHTDNINANAIDTQVNEDNITLNDLPVTYYEHEILDGLETSDVLLITGEPGCGKSTQVSLSTEY